MTRWRKSRYSLAQRAAWTNEVAKDQILIRYGKLAMKCCEKVPAEREEQPREEEGGGE
jgi:hypothetical protein